MYKRGPSRVKPQNDTKTATNIDAEKVSKIILRSMQNKSMIWKMTYIFFSKIYAHLGFDRDSSHEAEGYRLTEQTNDQTKVSAVNYDDRFSDD